MTQLNFPCNHTKSSSHVRKWEDLRWQRHETPCHYVLSSIACGRQREHNQKLEEALSCTLGLPRWPLSGRSGGWHHRCQMFAFAISLESILRQRKVLSSWSSCVLSFADLQSVCCSTEDVHYQCNEYPSYSHLLILHMPSVRQCSMGHGNRRKNRKATKCSSSY